MSDVATAKAYLQMDSGNGVSLYDHLASVVAQLLEQQPGDALASFESISSSVKGATFVPEGPASNAVADATYARAKTLSALFDPACAALTADGMEADDAPKNDCGDVADVYGEAAMFEKAGVGLGSAESYRASLAIKALGENGEFALSSVRFFGKIFGKQADYYVAEGSSGTRDEAAALTEEEVAAKVVKPEPAGVGANKCLYFVCAKLGEPWVKLPDVTPAQIVVSRQLKKLLSGDLAMPILGYPVFPGNEANLLRATIARIAAATTLAPDGMFSSEEADAEAGDAEPALSATAEFAVPGLEALATADGWVLLNRSLSAKQARCGWYAQPIAEPEEPAEGEEAPEPEEPEEPEAALGSLLKASGRTEPEDAALPELASNWSSKAGATGGVALFSARWPGATTVADAAGKFASIYIGNGIQYTGVAYSPPLPPPVETEADDSELVECADPTVAEEAEEKEKAEAAAEAAIDAVAEA